MTKEEIIKHLHEALNSMDITFPYRYVFVEAIEALSQLSLPSNLDEAAQKVEDYYDVGEERGYLCCHRGDIKDAFKAGAEWMAGQGVKLKCWIARDECSGDESNLYIGQKKPRRIPETAPGFGMWCNYGEFMALPPDMFPGLMYSDEPIEVELIIRKK